MKNAIITDGTPSEIKGRWYIDPDGTQHPIVSMSTEAKLALGVYEVEKKGTVPEGRVLTGTELVLEGKNVVEQPTHRDMTPEEVFDALPYQTAAQAKAAVVGWIDKLTNQVIGQYPQAVRERWPTEEAAARAVFNGTATSAQTRLITREGEVKGRTPLEHAGRIITLADDFREIADHVNTLFLAVDAQLDAAKPSQFESILEWAMQQAAPLAADYGLDAK